MDVPSTSYGSTITDGPTQCMPYINEGYGGDTDYITPPTAPEADVGEMPQITIPDFAALSHKEIRKACEDYIVESCCYGSHAVENMIFTSITNSCSLHYKLESFSEKRQSTKKFKPYYGEQLGRSQVVDPWQVSVFPIISFRDDQKTVEMPNSAYVLSCLECSGQGKVTCPSCDGDGWKFCWFCLGTGSGGKNKDKCMVCGGKGKNKCKKCFNTGKVTCNTCQEQGKLKHYKELTVIWKHHAEDQVINSMNLPIELIKSSAGREIFSEERAAVAPISQYPDASLIGASQQLIDKHKTEYSSNELIIKQRHSIRVIPITRVTYNWRRKTGEFYVYSLKNQVYFENYPQPCCFCICC